MARLERSAKNITLTLIGNLADSLLGIVSRTVFVRTLGSGYLGLSGLLGNILGILSFTELGIGSAIGFSLYRPLALGDAKTVSALMGLYRRAYRVVAAVVLVCGIGLYFALDLFIPPSQQPPEIGMAYFVYLGNLVLGYLWSYKITLLTADDHGYRLASLNVGMSVVQTAAQVLCLLAFRSYRGYLAVLLVCSTARMVIGNRLVTGWYPHIDFHSREKPDPDTTRRLRRGIGGLLIAKIGDWLVHSTDNLLLTRLVSLSATGIYSNYLLIRELINGYIRVLFGGISAGMGNVVAVESDGRKRELFETMLLCAYFIYSFEAVCFLCLFNFFIGEIWLGPEYTFELPTVAVIVVSNYLTGLRIPLITMKGAAGTWLEDAWVPFGFAAVNLAASVVLAKRLGVAGVFLGTIVGSLCTADWYRPIVIYRKVFHAPVAGYYRRWGLYVVLGLVLMGGTYGLTRRIGTPYPLLTFLLRGVVAAVVPSLVNCLLFCRTTEFHAIRAMAGRLLRRKSNGETGQHPHSLL